MEENVFTFEEVPYGFGLCAADYCKYAETCLRQIAYKCAPESYTYLPTLNPKVVKKYMMGDYECYRPKKKVQFARGFTRIAQAIPNELADTFRFRLIDSWGIEKYYQKRNGEVLLSTDEQLKVIALATELGIYQKEYFDSYSNEYVWE